MGTLAADKISHKIALSAKEQDEISDDMNVQPITKLVESQLVVWSSNLPDQGSD